MRSPLPAAAILSSALLLMVSAVGQAQSCLGAASFAAGPVRVGAGVDFTDGAKSYGVQLAFGSTSGPFGTAGLSAVDYDDVDEGGTIVSVAGGYALPLGPSRKAQFCPSVGFDWGSGPNFDTGAGVLELSFRTFSFGANLGAVATSTPTMDFVPFVGAHFVIARLTAEFDGATEREREDYGVVSLGAGFVLNRTLTIRPQLGFPVGVDEGDPSYGLAFAFNFGSAPGAARQRR